MTILEALSSGRNYYYLMNKDEKLLEFFTEKSLGSTSIKESQSFTELRPIGFVDIATWVDQRNYAKHKQHMTEWLAKWGMADEDGFLRISHALGLNDCLWVKPVSSSLTWEQVSLYSNDFDDVSSRTAFESGLYGLRLSSTSPEFTAEGSFPKCWIREGDSVYLYKAGLTGASNYGKEPYSEFMSSSISKKIFPSVDYDLVMFKSKLCTKCNMFTSEDTGFVPMYKVLKPGRKYNVSTVIEACESLGFGLECRYKFLVDSIVFNQDGHLGNMGFLVDNETFQIKGFAPFFDYNVSMLCNALDADLDNYDLYEEDYSVGHKLGGRFAEVGYQLLHDSKHLELPKSIELVQHSKYVLSNERLEKLQRIFETNLRKIRYGN